MTTLDLSADAVTLTEQLVNIESVSRNEQAIADAVEAALRALPHLTVTRRGHTVVARTELGRGRAGGDRGPPRHRAAQRQPPAPAARAACCTGSAPAT